MGYSLSWLAIKGKAPQAILHELGFRTTGERQEIPEAPLSAAEMPNGWYLIVSDHSEQVAPDSVLERLTAGFEAVACNVEEHVMFSSAAGWKDGRKCWSISHDSQQGIEHLDTQGEPPAFFGPIRNRLISKQHEENLQKPRQPRRSFRRKTAFSSQMLCDYVFDIPVEVAREITGYRHDQDIPELAGKPFEVLIAPAPKKSVAQEKPSFWKRLFSK